MNGIIIDIDRIKKQVYEQWIDTKNQYPDFLASKSYFQRVKNGKRMDRYSDEFFYILGNLSQGEDSIKAQRHEIEKLFGHWFVETVPKCRVKSGDMEIFISGMYVATEEFVREAKSFMKGISNEDIFQALRNVWAMLVYQYVTFDKVKLTKSIFAYSMLYPCTDNYLDDANISKDEKKKFNESVYKRLKGMEEKYCTKEVKYVFDLISLIEEEYPREKFSHIYEAMISMQKAQQNSLMQQDEYLGLNEKQLLEISIEKGGLSVLMHGYLVRGNIDIEEAKFLYGFGVLLQICDDIQDIEEDFKNNHYTLATKVICNHTLDCFTNNLLNFTKTTFSTIEGISKEEYKWVYDIMEDKIYGLIMFAAFKSRENYSKQYIKKIMGCFPYNSLYLKTFNLKINLKLRKLKKKLGNFNIEERLF